MEWLKKWWKQLGLGILVVFGAVAAFVSRKPKEKPDDAFDDLHNKQKEQKKVLLNDVSEQIKDAQDDLEQVENAAQHKVLETEKEDYSDAKNAVDSFNKP